MSRGLISVVVPAFNEADCLPKLHEELQEACDPLFFQFEFLFVDDGSNDGTVETLHDLRRRDPRVRFLSLSRNFGHQAALSAGLDHALGDAVIMMDGDLQHPPSLIPELITQWQAGFDIVNTVRLRTASISPVKRLCSALYYRLFNWATNVRIEPGGADFRLMSRRAVAALKELPERSRFLRGLVPWLGFRQTKVEFAAPSRWSGHSKYTWSRTLRFALDGLTAFNAYPLRKVGLLGMLGAGLSIAGGMATLAAGLLTSMVLPPWAWVVLGVAFFGSCQLVTTAVLGEYIGRILEQVRARPLYIVREEAGPTDADAPVPIGESRQARRAS